MLLEGKQVLVIDRDFDLGRSGLRMFDGKHRFVLDSPEYKEVDIQATVRKDIRDPYCDFVIKASPAESLAGRRFVKGLGIASVKGIREQADNQHLKVEQEESFINFAYMYAREIIDNLPNGYDAKTTPIIAKAGVCIPTAEYYSDKYLEMKEKLIGAYCIYFPVTEETVKFEISEEDVVVSPEGPAAMEPIYLYGSDEEVDLIETTTGMIIDIGYGSTDATPIDAGEPLGDIARSFSYGGITLRSAITSALEREGFGMTSANTTLAIERGYVRLNGDKEDVSPYVNTCKDRLARKVKQSAAEVMNEDFRQLTDLAYLFCMGRSFKSKEDSKDAEYDIGDLKEKLKDAFGNNIRIITPVMAKGEYTCLNRTKTEKDGSYAIDTDIDKYEFANVYGLGIARGQAKEDAEGEVENRDAI